MDGRYVIEGELGHGGMGVVYLADDVHLRRKVALKTIAPAYERDAALLARFRREAMAIASVRHENVVQVFSFCDGPSPAFVMEYVEGPTLGDILHRHLRQRASLPIGQVLAIVRRIASALDAVHEVGILHRDVKPENVLIEEGTGRPVLIDFGIVGSSENLSDDGCGTPEYMAPEMCPGSLRFPAAVTSRADVYSLACTAFTLLTGRHVFETTSRSDLLVCQRFDEAPAPSSIVPELARFDPVFARAFRKNPADRHATAGELAMALDAAGKAWSLAMPAAPALPSLQRAAMHALIVGHDEVFRRFATRAVQLAYYRGAVVVRWADSADGAIEAARAEPPHLVMLDCHEPGLEGLHALARLRDLPRGADARVLLTSTCADQLSRDRLALLGVVDIVKKPVTLATLVDTINRVRPDGAAATRGPYVAPFRRASSC